MSTRISEIGRLVREFREGREIPPGLCGTGRDDRALATITDGLDKLFATLDLSRFRGTPKPPPARTAAMRVVARSVLCHNEEVVALTFGTGAGTELAGWTPGSHVDVTLPSGSVRQYSLCGDPRETDSYTVAVRLIPDGLGRGRPVGPRRDPQGSPARSVFVQPGVLRHVPRAGARRPGPARHVDLHRPHRR